MSAPTAEPHRILTPLGDGAKFVVVPGVHAHQYTLMFVDGHGYSRAVACSVVNGDPGGIELEWLGQSAARYHGIPCERES